MEGNLSWTIETQSCFVNSHLVHTVAIMAYILGGKYPAYTVVPNNVYAWDIIQENWYKVNMYYG